MAGYEGNAVKDRITFLEAELARSKADNQEIMRINNQLRDTMMALRHLIDANVK